MGQLDKTFDTLTGLHLMMDHASGGNTTLTAVAAKGASTVNVTAATSFAVGDDIRIGSGETMEMARIGGIASLEFTLEKPLLFDHDDTEAVVEMAAVSLGAPEADGVKINIPAEATDVFSAIQRSAYGTLIGYVDLGISWRFMAITTDILAYALGLPRSAVIGDGTLAAQTGTVGPRLFTTDGIAINTLANTAVVATGKLQDGSHVRAEMYNLSFNPTSLTTTFSRGQQANVPVTCTASSGAFDFTNAAFVPSTSVNTFASSNADLFSEILNVERLIDSGTSTTTTAGVAAGAYVIPVTSVTGIVANSWIAVDIGDIREWHQVHSIASLNVNLRTQVKTGHNSGVSVVLQTKVPFAGITGGFTISVSGTATPQRAETSRTTLRTRVANASPQFAFRTNTLTPEALQLALGMASSAYANNRLPLGNTIATSLRATLLFTGLTQGGKLITMCGWNGAAQINAELNMTQAAELQAAIAYKLSTFQVFVHA